MVPLHISCHSRSRLAAGRNRHPEGYFRPIPGNVVDEYYFHEYMAKEKSRLKELDKKIGAMETTYEMWKKEAISEQHQLFAENK